MAKVKGKIEEIVGIKLSDPQYLFDTTNDENGQPRLVWRATYRCYEGNELPEKEGRSCWAEMEILEGRIITISC